MELIWIPGRQGIVIGSPLDKTVACKDFQSPLVVMTKKIDDLILREITTIFSTIDTLILWSLAKNLELAVSIRSIYDRT